ncbi:unnamed protein product, partial [Ectocarpus sp. 8 AP-2014]
MTTTEGEWQSAVARGDATKLAELVLDSCGSSIEPALSVLNNCVSLLEEEAARGRTKCMDAFGVILNQTCDGQGKFWHASALELQLVSLEFCRACRSVQTFHVRVDEHTPPTLMSPCTSYTTPGEHSPEVCISSRVPAVQAFCWTWKLSTDLMPQRAANELQAGPERRRQNGHKYSANVG